MTWFIFYLTACVGISIAYTVSAYAPDADAANAILPTYITMQLLLSGYIIATSDVPLGWRWYMRCDYLYYSWTSLMRENFRGHDTAEFAPGVDVLDYYDLRRAPTVSSSILALLIFFAVFLIIAAYGFNQLAVSGR